MKDDKIPGLHVCIVITKEEDAREVTCKAIYIYIYAYKTRQLEESENQMINVCGLDYASI